MVCFKQCYVPLSANKKCSKTTISKDNIRSSEHHKISRKLYNKYKIAYDQANSLVLDEGKSTDLQKKIKHLMKCYAVSQNVYNLRMKFKIKYITPVYSDNSHEHQFTIIRKSIDICEETSLQEKKVDTKSELEKEPNFSEKVEIFKKKRFER